MTEADAFGVTTPKVTGSTRALFHALQMRQDGDAWVIGRLETGDFITAPATAHRAITLLSAGKTIEDAQSVLRAETGADVDVIEFVNTLVALGFVKALDDQLLDTVEPQAPTLPRLRPEHVRWLLHPATAMVAGTAVLAGVIAMVVEPIVVPTYQDMLWSQSGAAVLFGNAIIAWTLIALHEFGHLATARAVGVPSRLSLGTRLLFLAAQTDVTGVWAAPRHTRLTVYLAGITSDLAVAGMCMTIRALINADGLTADMLAATALIATISVSFQFLVFMRTDIYFVIQDLARCANLYADGAAYTRYLARRMWCSVHPRSAPSDPSLLLGRHERRAVRAYTLVLVIGTATCVGIALTVTVPVTVTLLARAVSDLAGGGTLTIRLVDSAVVLTIISMFNILWLRAWWRRHGTRVRHWVGPISPRRPTYKDRR